MQLTEAEAAFRIHKTDLSIRPIWHQKEERVLAHILVCFLAYVLWKTPRQICRQAGLGDEPRRVLDELPRSAWLMSSCPRETAPKSGNAVSLAQRSTSRSCSIDCNSGCHSASNRRARPNNPKSNVVEKSTTHRCPQRLTSKVGEVGLDRTKLTYATTGGIIG